MELEAWDTFTNGISMQIGSMRAAEILQLLGALPVKASRATGLLGS